MILDRSGQLGMPLPRDHGGARLKRVTARPSLQGFARRAVLASMTAPAIRHREPRNTMHKLRQVRLHYPDAFVELALALQADYDKRDVAVTLAVPLSTLYRWAVENRGRQDVLAAGWSQRRQPDELHRLTVLVAQCESDGFQIAAAVSRLVPMLGTSTQASVERVK